MLKRTFDIVVSCATLALPFSSVMTEDRVDRVCTALRAAVEQARG